MVGIELPPSHGQHITYHFKAGVQDLYMYMKVYYIYILAKQVHTTLSPSLPEKDFFISQYTRVQCLMSVWTGEPEVMCFTSREGWTIAVEQWLGVWQKILSNIQEKFLEWMVLIKNKLV